MPEGQKEKRITCVSCGRLLATGAMSDGMITIRCKCGVDNTIQAVKKPEGRKYFIDHEPGFDAAGRMQEISMVLKRAQ